MEQVKRERAEATARTEATQSETREETLSRLNTEEKNLVNIHGELFEKRAVLYKQLKDLKNAYAENLSADVLETSSNKIVSLQEKTNDRVLSEILNIESEMFGIAARIEDIQRKLRKLGISNV